MLVAEEKLMINELLTSKFLRIIANSKTRMSPKTKELSNNARKEGNRLYVQNNHSAQMHEDIFRLYSKSIAFAPNKSEELALGYGNRSALLMHLKKYKESIQDIERALKITTSSSLKEKLLKRKLECFTFLNSPSKRETGFLHCREAKNVPPDKHNKEYLDSSKLSTFEHLSINSKQKDEDLLKFPAQKGRSIDSVTVRYNDKYGRHLVATREIKPGEIIFAGKPYVACLNIKKSYIYCSHCLSVAWAGIPCEHCGWFMFCSETCKIEAWNQYHEIECFCIVHIAHYVSYVNEETERKVCFDGLSIRALIKGLKELGDLEKLKAEMKIVDNCTDKKKKGFSKNGKFESHKFRSLYSLTSDISQNEIDSHVSFAGIALVCIAKYTKFFGSHFEFCDLEKLTKNVDVIFVGSLILRLSKISNINSHGIVNVNDECKNYNDLITCRKSWCCVKGNCIVPFASLTNNSCNPNARRCFGDNLQFILYALQPIKKNSQICDSYYCTFFETSNPHRQNTLEENFNFKCDCIACENNWPAWPIAEVTFEAIIPSIKMSSRELDVWIQYRDIIKSIEDEKAKYNEPLLNHVSKAIEESMKTLPQPSVVTYKFIFTLLQVFEKIYGCKVQEFEECII